MLRHIFKQLADFVLRHSNFMSRHTLRRAPEETLKLCHDIEIIVVTNSKFRRQEDCCDKGFLCHDI